jgi:hypothetical protein
MEYRSVGGGQAAMAVSSFEPYWVCRRCAVRRRRNYHLVLRIAVALAISGLLAVVLNRLFP